MRQPIILDTDIGDDIDDSFALLLAVLSGKVELLGVTTCFRDTVKRAKIAKALLKALGQKTEVYAGEGLPLNNHIVYANFDRFDADQCVVMPHYLEAFDTETFSPVPAVDYILDTLKKQPHEITLVSIGPMTNLARAYMKDPATFRLAKQILFMGGHPTTSFKEWNIRSDVEAAHLVFGSGVPVVMVGINVTGDCRLTPAHIERFMGLEDTGYRPLMKAMLQAYLDFFDGQRLPVMHDPLTVSCLFERFCTFESHPIDVVLEGPERGRTRISEHNHQVPVQVAKTSDSHRFLEYLFHLIETTPILSS